MAETLIFSDDTDKGQTQEEIPQEERLLRTQAYDKSVSDVVDMITNSDIILNPEYQRNYVWNNKKASLLVESILLNVPIPIVYVSEDDDSRWSVVDGLQRLNSLRRFFGNEFKLTGLEVLQELNGYQYYKLNSKAQRILRNGILRIILIFKESHPEIKYDIFMRLNKGSIQLNEQELRNCLYRGKFNDSLKALVHNTFLLEILRLKKPHKRMRDVEIVLRYFAITEDYNIRRKKMKKYKGSMRTFLNSYLEGHKKSTEKKSEEIMNRFHETIEKVYKVFGDNAFRRINEDGSYDRSINRAIADFIMLSFENIDSAKLISKKSSIIALLKKLPEKDEEFYDSITIGTSDTKNLEYRLSAWMEELNNIY